MHKNAWVYTSGGFQHKVGLIFDLSSQKAQLFLNEVMVQEKVLVEASETLQLFIDNELCEVHIGVQGAEVYSSFEAKHRSSSNRSKERRRSLRRVGLRAGLIVLFLFLLIVALPLGSYVIKENRKAKALNKRGVQTLGRISLPPSSANIMNNLYYRYEHKGKMYYGGLETPVKDNGIMLGPLDLPLGIGQDYTVTYLPDDPEVSKIDLEAPGENAIRLFKHLSVQEVISELNADRTGARNLNFSTCIVEAIYEYEGVQGLALLYHREGEYSRIGGPTPLDYEAFMNRPKMRRALKQCQDKYLSKP